MPRELEPLLDSFDSLNAAVQLGKAVELKRISIVQSVWKDLKTAWKFDQKQVDETCTSGRFLGELLPNSFVRVNGLTETSRSYFRDKGKQDQPKYFGLCCDAYHFEDKAAVKKNASLEIRFNGHFYVALYGEGDTRILPKAVVESFYEALPPDRYSIPDISKNKVKEEDRVILKNSVNFNGNSKEFLELADKDKRKQLVAELLGMAHYIIDNLRLIPIQKSA